MDPGSTARGLSERGFTSIQFALACGLSLILFVLLANLVVIQYGRGALRSAAEQGARVGSVAGVDSCEETMRVVVSDLLGGRMSDEIQLSCGVVGSEVVATVAGRFQPWIPLVPSFEASLTSSAALEPSL